MRIHCIMCTYLGDGELDIGKTGRWAQWFVDSMFFYDANGTDNRKFAIDYAKSFPDCKFAQFPGTLTPYHIDPTVMRQQAFAAADAAWKYDPNDWVIFVDGTEGISTDVPHDALEWTTSGNSFRYLYDEATQAAQPYLDLAMRIFISQGSITQHTFTVDPNLPVAPDNQAVWWECHPQYVGEVAAPWRSLLRMAKVSYWRTFTDWFLLDSYTDSAATASTSANHVSLISYSYARFSEINYHDPSLWTIDTDEGWPNRIFLNQVPGRQVSELPLVYSTPDPAGMTIPIPPGPAHITARQNMTAVTMFDFVGDVTQESGNETYSWQFGDTTTGTGKVITHTYPAGNQGPFNVILTVHDPDTTPDRTAQVTIRPGTANPITPQAPATPTTPPTRMLSPPYCHYTNQMRNTYIMAFSALFRRNPRDGVWWVPLQIGPAPTSPVDGTVQVDQGQWSNLQPVPRNQPIPVADQPGPGV